MSTDDSPHARGGGSGALPDDDNGDTAALAQAVTDEELFAAYLAARVQQGLDALDAVRGELATQPNDFNRVLQVIRKVQELRELRQELGAQQARVNAARSAAGLAPASPDPSPQPLEPSQPDPGAAFRTAQAEHAARIMAALAAKPRTCPSCQALLTADTGRCHCGYALRAEPGSVGRDSRPN